jgi:predicted membrane metal-binding protein
MTVAEPLSLRSVGLQLSFAATLAVLACLPFLQRPADARIGSRAGRIRALLRPLAAAFVTSVAVEVFIAPLQLHHFGVLSVVGPVATVVFFIPVTVVLLGAAPVAALSALMPAHEWPGAALGGISGLTSGLIVTCGRAAPPLLAMPEPDPWLYYGGVMLGWRLRHRRAGWALAAALVALSFL